MDARTQPASPLQLWIVRAQQEILLQRADRDIAAAQGK
jgi:hypothetical protein